MGASRTGRSHGCCATSPPSSLTRLAATTLPPARQRIETPSWTPSPPHAVPYVDVPLQHASSASCAVCGAWRRRHLALLARVRSVLPSAACGRPSSSAFPAKPEADFEELLDFVAEARPAVGGVFVYDPQEGTTAAGMARPIPRRLALERAALLSETIDREATRYWEALAGRRLEVLVERGTSRPDGVVAGRCAVQAPDVDGRTFVRGARARRGDVIRAVAAGSLGYDVEAVAATGGP